MAINHAVACQCQSYCLSTAEHENQCPRLLLSVVVKGYFIDTMYECDVFLRRICKVYIFSAFITKVRQEARSTRVTEMSFHQYIDQLRVQLCVSAVGK